MSFILNLSTFYILAVLKLVFVKTQCTGTPSSISVNEASGSFRYPESGEYSVNLNCAWLIESASGQPLLYKFSDVDVPCTNDAIDLYDGSSSSASQVQSGLCTSVSAFSTPIATSSTQFLYLTLTTDGTATPGKDNGFQFLAVSSSDQSLCSSSGSKRYLPASTTSKVITTPNFPNTYPTSHTCEWIISPSSSTSTLTVQFSFVDVESSGSSCYDKVTVNYGDSLSLSSEFCGNEDYAPNRVFDNAGSGGNITILFESDSVQAERGFVATYIETEITTSATSEEVSTSTDSSSTPSSITLGTTAFTVSDMSTNTGSTVTTSSNVSDMSTNAGSTVMSPSNVPEGENNNSEEKSDDAKIAGGVVGGAVGVCALGALGLVGYKKGLISPSRLKKFITGNKVDPEKAYPEDVKRDRDDDEPPSKTDCNENKQGSSSSLQTKNETAVDAKSELHEESVKKEESSETKYKNLTPDRNE